MGIDQQDQARTTTNNETARAVDRSRRKRRILATAGIATALSFGGAGVAIATTTAKPHATSGAASAGAGLPGGPGGPGAGRGVVSAIGVGSVTVTTPAGTSVTYTTNGSTVYKLDQATAAASTLAVGDNVSIETVRPTSTTTTPSTTATEIDIMSPGVGGTVVSISGNSIVVADAQGFWRTIDVDGSTTYRYGGQASTLSAVTTGAQLRASGSIASNHTDLQATEVDVVLPVSVGSVTAVSGSTITLKESSTKTVTVTTTSSTTYRTRTGTTTAAEVKSGSVIAVEGVVAANGDVSATSISVLPAAAGRMRAAAGGAGGPGGQGGPGGPGGFGGPAGGPLGG